MLLSNLRLNTRGFSKIACASISTLSLQSHNTLRQKILTVEEKLRCEKDIISRNLFIKSFPEISHYIEDEDLRNTLNELEEDTWMRGKNSDKNSRKLRDAEKRWFRRRIIGLLERTHPTPITEEVVKFLESYLKEKNVL